MDPSEQLIDFAELLASLSRRMTVLHAAGLAAGFVKTPAPAVPERLAEHVRYYTGILGRNPAMGPLVEEVLERFQQAGKDLARVEAELADPAESLQRLQQHQRYLEALLTTFAACPPLQQLFAPKSPPAPPPPRSLTGRLLPPNGKARPAFPENQALLDRGLAQLRALDARLMLIRAACAMAANPAAPPSLALPIQARETARRLAGVIGADPQALDAFQRLVEQHAATKKRFDQRPLQNPDAARAALEQLAVAAAALDEHPAVGQLLGGR